MFLQRHILCNDSVWLYIIVILLLSLSLACLFRFESHAYKYTAAHAFHQSIHSASENKFVTFAASGSQSPACQSGCCDCEDPPGTVGTSVRAQEDITRFDKGRETDVSCQTLLLTGTGGHN